MTGQLVTHTVFLDEHPQFSVRRCDASINVPLRGYTTYISIPCGNPPHGGSHCLVAVDDKGRPVRIVWDDCPPVPPE